MSQPESSVTESPPATSSIARARWAITAVFFVNGAVIGTYLVRIPSLKANLQLSEPALAAVLTCFSLAALVMMQSVGSLVARFGSRRVIRTMLAALPFALIGIGFARTATQLAVAVALAGAVHGMLDVAMSAHAVTVERLRRRPILNGCHAAWGLSSIAAALLGAAMIGAGVSLAEHTMFVAVLALAAGLFVTAWLLPGSADQGPGTEPSSRRWRSGWSRRVFVFGLIGLALMLAEAAVISWSGVYLHENRGASLALAALGYTAFTTFQTLGRLTGDRVISRLGRVSAFRLHACLVVLGFTVVVLARTPYAALGGFALLGYGSSILVPSVFSTVGQLAGDGPGTATLVSRVATFTYAGILTGPAVVGWLAQGIGLTWTFAVLIPLMAVVAASARVLRPTSGPAVLINVSAEGGSRPI